MISRNDDKEITDALVLEKASNIRDKIPQIGTAKLYFLLKDFLLANRQSLNSLLKKNNMLVYRTKRKPRTTNSDHPFRKYPNLIKKLVVERPNQLWVSDITASHRPM
ncbi:hypothetical protein [Chondrinema litorale]|uniref:hypothetical protein n=1 Tax=Chondrinema litorale TaxID=2994555 RepID=UPI002542EE58|nr:hypothetical protein [Chondrinema litorale]UZR97138.1 hypothetical protein OQ292_23865 [Chondrinema litorale]